MRHGIDKAGTECVQDNECVLRTHDCGTSLTCVDRVPPLKWECIEPTPAPTNQPTPRPTAPLPAAAATTTCTPLVPDLNNPDACNLCGQGCGTTAPDIVLGIVGMSYGEIQASGLAGLDNTCKDIGAGGLSQYSFLSECCVE